MKIDLSNALKCSASIQVHAHWDPIADSTFNMHNESEQHFELFTFSPNHPIKEYRTDAFKAFLPSFPVAVGDVWQLDPLLFLPFLRQFHHGATTSVYHGVEGAFACLRSVSSYYVEVIFRIHADFTLETVAYQKWQRSNASEDDDSKARFIPSQFAGRLRINRQKGTVCAFSLFLPSRNSNVDISAFYGIDMVFVPRMELLANTTEDMGKVGGETAITEAAARKALELKFYKFAEIDWLPIDAAVARSKATHCPIHAILLWGQLDDESC